MYLLKGTCMSVLLYCFLCPNKDWRLSAMRISWVAFEIQIPGHQDSSVFDHEVHYLFRNLFIYFFSSLRLLNIVSNYPIIYCLSFQIKCVWNLFLDLPMHIGSRTFGYTTESLCVLRWGSIYRKIMFTT